SAVFLAAVWLVTGALSDADQSRFGQALCLSLIMLSLVLLTGYGGDVSLCQMSFVGVGAIIAARTFHAITPLSLVSAFVVAGAVGVLVAVPALRLRGLYLGLGTMAVAAAMDNMVFPTKLLGFRFYQGSITIDRPSLLESERAMTMAVAVAFVVTAMIVLAIRRGKYGRILLASRDSQAACATLGFSTTTVRVLVFGVSAGLAGVAGVLYTGMRVSVGSEDFTFFKSLPLLLFAAVAGLTSVSGALVGGLFYGALPVIADRYPSEAPLAYVVLLGGILALGGNPNGLVHQLFGVGRRIRRRVVPLPAPDEGVRVVTA
ncbi:MAG: branched-chain amino acid ABC transporter permease, partial [Actinomycetota bacterium]|nr:branched-chain amino acid ABC transporter permease [Actinomycetota bacterium]